MKVAKQSISWGGPKPGRAREGDLVDEMTIPKAMRDKLLSDLYVCDVCGYQGGEGPAHVDESTLEPCSADAVLVRAAILVDQEK